MPEQRQLGPASSGLDRFDAPTEEPIELRRLLDALWRSRFLIAGIVVVLTGGVLAISLVLPKSYRATAKVVLGGEGASVSADAESLRRRLFTLRSLLTTPEVLRTAANRLPDETKATLERKTRASVDPDASVINVVATDSDASGAAKIANTVALTFVEKQSEAERQRLRQERAALLAELNQVRSSPESGVQITALRERLSELVVLEARAGSELQLAELAEPPSDPRSPSPIRNAMLAFVAAVVIAVLVALARQSLAPRVGSVSELSRLTGLPVMDMLPPASLTVRPVRSPDHRLDASDERTNDAFQSLRASLVHRLPRDRQQVLLVTGPRDDESKTSVVAGLGRALAQAGNATLLVSADLRRPALARLIGVPEAPGLTEIIVGLRGKDGSARETIAATIRRLPTNAGEGALHVLTGGKPPASPASVFASDGFDVILDTISSLDYTYVLIDGPPLVPSAESQILTRLVDCMLIASRLDQLTVANAVELRETLNSLDVRPLGLVVIGGLRERRTSVSALIQRTIASDRSSARDSADGALKTPRMAEIASRAPNEMSSFSSETPDRSAGTGRVSSTASREQETLELLSTFGRPVQEGELRKVLGYSRSTILRHLDRLVERAEVGRSGTGRRGDPYLYERRSHPDRGKRTS